ncbi:MAG TPA: SRPBCC family protein [Candidatus Binatia bacterium]|jgi:uncharacterized membrane protein
METIEKWVDVNVPVSTVYNQWTQFEDFPRFMEGIESVTQKDDTHLHWVANIAGKRVEWDATISEQIPDKRIVWHSDRGAVHSGMVSFNPIRSDMTRMTLRIDYEPEGIVEETGDKLGLLSRRVEGDLERFKHFIEERRVETGAWRGSV